MNFHALPRKDLQTLCKKNSIRANMTNAAMADALQALDVVEGTQDIQLEDTTETEDISQDSPRGEWMRSVPRTGGRTSTRRKPIKGSGLKEPEESPAVSTVRTRRGAAAAKAESVRRRICEEEDEEKEDNVHLQPTLVEDDRSGVPKTPATHNGRKRATKADTSALKGAESHNREEKENENPVAFGLKTYSTRRSTRLSAKILQEAPPTIRKSRGKKEAVKIMALSEESELKEGSEKLEFCKADEQGASIENVGKDLDKDPVAVAADAASAIPRGGNEDTILESPTPTEIFNPDEKESIEEDLQPAKAATESKEQDENPIESSKTEEDTAIVMEAAGASPLLLESSNLECKNRDMDTQEVSFIEENDDSKPHADWELNLKNANDGASAEGPTKSSMAEDPPVEHEETEYQADADEVIGKELENTEGGSSSEAAEETLIEQEADEVGYGVLCEGKVDQVPEATLETLAFLFQENVTLKCNPEMEQESATDGGISSSSILGHPILESEICKPDDDQDIGLKDSAEESDEENPILCLGEENTMDFSSDEVPPLEDPKEDDDLIAIEHPMGEGRSNSLEEDTLAVATSEESDFGGQFADSSFEDFGGQFADSSFEETETVPTTTDGADQSFPEIPNHISDAIQSPPMDGIRSRTPVNLRSSVVETSDSGKMSGNKSNKKTLAKRLSLSNKKTPIKGRIFEDADKENKNEGGDSVKGEGKEFGSLRKVKDLLIEDIRQQSLKKKSMRQLRRIFKEKIVEKNKNEMQLLDKRSPLQMLSENCLTSNEEN